MLGAGNTAPEVKTSLGMYPREIPREYLVDMRSLTPTQRKTFLNGSFTAEITAREKAT